MSSSGRSDQIRKAERLGFGDEPPHQGAGIRALTFDIIGTAFDMYGSLERGAPALAASYGFSLDPASFAYGSYMGYAEAVASINAGAAWTPPDTIVRDATLAALPPLGENSSTILDAFVGLWRTLAPWDDVRVGLGALHGHFTLAVLSNMSVAAQSALAFHSSLPFDRMLSAASVQRYKPNPAVYEMAITSLGLLPAQILMVAAHDYDLNAAKAQGMHTAFVARPQELGAHPTGQVPSTSYDYNAESFTDLARQLGVAVPVRAVPFRAPRL
jgi:2-haloacid dehalogenase